MVLSFNYTVIKLGILLASGIINTLIVGGAVVPLLIRSLTDVFNARGALLIPILCYGYIALFALKGSRIR